MLGARSLVVAGHHDRGLERIAASTGATVCNTARDDLRRVVADRAGASGVDVAIEANGSGDAPAAGIELLRPRGTLVIFSYIWRPRALDMGAIHMRELNLVGSCRSRGAFAPCIDLIAQGRLDTETLLDAVLPLERFGEALRLLESDRERVFKVGLTPKGPAPKA